MGQPQVEKKKYTTEEWLALEESENIRYEYHFGEVYSMAGGTVKHGTIADNIFFETETHNRAKGGKCRSLSSEFKTVIDKNGRYVYPDTTVVFGKVEDHPQVRGAYTNPVLVVEVVSESSANYDRKLKYKYYRKLPTVKEYLILEQYFVSATLYRRNGNGDLFTRIEVDGEEAIIELESIDLKIQLGKFYRNVNFAE